MVKAEYTVKTISSDGASIYHNGKCLTVHEACTLFNDYANDIRKHEHGCIGFPCGVCDKVELEGE